GTITESYSTGDITGDSCTGGIAGCVGGTVTRSYSTGDVTSSDSAGGIAGYVQSGGTISSCAAANEKIAYSGSGTVYLGRVVGRNDSSIANDNFANSDMKLNGVIVSDGTDENGIGKPLSELQTQTTYEDGLDWQFGSSDAAPWKMSVNTGYPIFYWQE
ncbi:MAG: hypothetical protein LBD73_05060, partial [Deferribacteraceae bacterium]|nr:hypothetical protein [Deferribacteraceae bacterium]